MMMTSSSPSSITSKGSESVVLWYCLGTAWGPPSTAVWSWPPSCARSRVSVITAWPCACVCEKRGILEPYQLLCMLVSLLAFATLHTCTHTHTQHTRKHVYTHIHTRTIIAEFTTVVAALLMPARETFLKASSPVCPALVTYSSIRSSCFSRNGWTMIR